MAKILEFEGSEKDAPSNILRKVPARPKNSDVRSREYLTPDEVDALTTAAGKVGRHRLRDCALILMTYRHGFRVSEVVDLKWDQIDLKAGRIHVNRLKNGNPATHYLEGDEMRALRRVRRQYPDGPFVFSTERGGPECGTIISGPSAYAEARLRVLPGQQGCRYADYPRLSRPQEHSTHCEIHTTNASQVQRAMELRFR